MLRMMLKLHRKLLVYKRHDMQICIVNPASHDAILSFTPSVGIEERQSITFTSTCNVGKPQGRFIWIRIRRLRKQLLHTETTTFTVMPGTCTFNGTSTFTMMMTHRDNYVVVRCQVIYGNIAKVYKKTNPKDKYCKLSII